MGSFDRRGSRWIFSGIAGMPRLPRLPDLEAEISDLFVLLVSWIVPVFCWLVFLNWHGTESIGQHDDILIGLPFLQEVKRVGGNLDQLIYRPQWLGGTSLDASLGVFWLFRLLTHTGLAISSYQNIFIFFLQAVYAYLGVKFVEGCSVLFGVNRPNFWKIWKDRKNGSLLDEVFLLAFQVIAFAFMPTLAWKITYGHWLIVLGSLVFFSILSVIFSSFANRITKVHCLVTVGIVASTFQIIHQQAHLYGWTFGFPILIGVLYLRSEKNIRKLDVVQLCLLIFLSGLFLSMRSVSVFIDAVRTGEVGRFSDLRAITYDFITATWRDWTSSLTWGWNLISNNRPLELRHESNYPFGVPLLFLAVFPWKKVVPLGIGLGLSTALVLCFSTNFTPISTLLLTVIPILQNLRVPIRAALPLVFLLPALVLSAILIRSGARSKTSQRKYRSAMDFGVAWVVFCGMAFLFQSLSGWYREGFSILVFLGFSLTTTLDHFKRYRVPPWFWVGFIALGNLLAFRERAIQPHDYRSSLVKFDAASAYLLEKAPELKMPLNRAEIRLGPSVLGNNLGFYLGISNLEGYFPPATRFLHLILALAHQRYEQQAINISSEQLDPSFPILSQLYNIKYRVLVSNGHLGVLPLGAQASLTHASFPAWFPNKIEKVDSYENLASELGRVQTEPNGILETVFALPEPDFAEVLDRLKMDPTCKASKVSSVDTEMFGQEVIVRFQASADCLLVLSMNFNRAFVAEQLDEKGNHLEVSTPVVPVYGALTGVLVSQKASVMKLRALRMTPVWVSLSFYLGLLLALYACWFSGSVLRNRR